MGDSVQVSPRIVEKRAQVFADSPWLQAAGLLLPVGWLYASTFVGLAEQWWHDKDVGHIPFVPLFSLFILWQNRQRLRAVASGPSWTGAFIILFAMALLVLGNLGADVFTSRVSLVVLLAGFVVLFRGWSFFRAVLFPWAFLFLMIPIPKIILQNITFPLQMVASKVATALLQLAQIPVYREGNVIYLPVMPLEVAEACSGIRSLLSLITLALIYGYLMDQRKWVRVVLGISAMPIAVAANGFRIFGTGLIGQYFGRDKAEGFLHSFQGWLVFVVSLLMLFALHGLINRIWKERPQAKGERDRLATGTQVGAEPRRTRASLAYLAMALVLVLGTAVGLQVRTRTEVLPSRAELSSMPLNIDGWVGKDYALDDQTLDILGRGEFLSRNYVSQGDSPTEVEMFIAYYPSQRVSETPHSPDHCLFGAGFVPSHRDIVQLPGPDGRPFPANRYVVSKAGERFLVLYWFQAHGRAISNQYWSKYYLIADSIRMNRSDGSLIRLMTPMNKKESPEAAQARLWTFGSKIVPLLDRYIPL